MKSTGKSSGNLVKGGGGLDHRCRYSVQSNTTDVSLGVNQRVVLVRHFQSLRIERKRCDFYNMVMST